jgi:hypothetical protein
MSTMGRKKIGKPRKERSSATGRFSLRQLNPPGDLYRRWTARPAPGSGRAAALDWTLPSELAHLVQRIEDLAPVYDGALPDAAIHLDAMIDTGEIVLLRELKPYSVPLAQAAKLFGQAEDGEQYVRASLHRLHAAGLFLMVGTEEDPALQPVVPPMRPGDQWLMEDPFARDNVTVCLPNDAVLELEPEEFAALGYIRECQGAGRTPEPEGLMPYLRSSGATIAQARQLLETVGASEWVRYRGCSNCPAAARCTRREEKSAE